MRDLILSGFSYSTFKEQKFWFQFKFRTSSISYIFKKDFISALSMVFIFQLINFTYLNLFKQARFENFTTLATEAYVQDCIIEYN